MSPHVSSTSGDGLRGGLFMCIAMASFIVNDTIAKWLGLRVGEFIFVRGIFASLFILVWLAAIGRLNEVRFVFSHGVVVRAGLDFIATALFIFALFHMPIGDLTAIQQASPLLGTLLAWLILSERVGWRRILAILAGFLGVLLIAKPGVGGLNIYALAALASMLGSALRDVVTRRIPAKVSSLVVALGNALLVCGGGLVLALIEGPQAIPAVKVGWLALSAAFLVGGYFFFILALRVGDIGSTAPFRYTNIVYAIIAGYLIFGDIPDRYTLAGILLVVSAGLFAIYRETRAARLAGQLNSLKQ